MLARKPQFRGNLSYLACQVAHPRSNTLKIYLKSYFRCSQTNANGVGFLVLSLRTKEKHAMPSMSLPCRTLAITSVFAVFSQLAIAGPMVPVPPPPGPTVAARGPMVPVPPPPGPTVA